MISSLPETKTNSPSFSVCSTSNNNNIIIGLGLQLHLLLLLPCWSSPKIRRERGKGKNILEAVMRVLESNQIRHWWFKLTRILVGQPWWHIVFKTHFSLYKEIRTWVLWDGWTMYSWFCWYVDYLSFPATGDLQPWRCQILNAWSNKYLSLMFFIAFIF